MGLSFNIQDKLDKKKIANTDLLINKLRMYNSGYNNKKKEDKMKFNNNNVTVNGKSNIDKKYSITVYSIQSIFYLV